MFRPPNLHRQLPRSAWLGKVHGARPGPPGSAMSTMAAETIHGLVGDDGWLLVELNSNPTKTSCPVSASSVAAQGDTASRPFGGTTGAAASSDPAGCSRWMCANAISFHYFVEKKYIGDLFLGKTGRVAFWKDNALNPPRGTGSVTRLTTIQASK